MSKIHIYGGGTFSHVRSHMALCAPAFGGTAKRLHQLLLLNSDLHLTKMVDVSSELVTNDDIKSHVMSLLEDNEVKCIIMNAALCDYDGQIGDVESGKYAERLESRAGDQSMTLTPSSKVISLIKERRPDIVTVGFKTTVNETDDSVVDHKAKRMGVDIVFANDVGLKKNKIYNFVENVVFSDDDRDKLLIKLSKLVNGYVTDDSPIKNVRHFKQYTTYAVEVLKSNGRAHAFRVACDILRRNGIDGDFRDGKWALHHQWIYYVTVKNATV